ncbi:MAG TPA: phage portal protein, partial [Paracoccaceae bacterium]|nr:phage portal protein [Paracoccaceae bacterium]
MAFRLFRRASRPEAVKASAAASIVAVQGVGRAAWSPRDQMSLARNGYQQNVIGFRAVRMVAEAAAAVKLITCEECSRVVDHPVAELLRRPNPGADGQSFLEAVYGHLQLSGNAYIEGAAHDGRGWPRELHALRPDRMRVVPGPDGWPMAYEYAVGNAKHRWSMEGDLKPILHIRAFHPLDDHYGMSPLEAAAGAVDTHNAAAAWAKALLDNAARPSGAIVFGASDGSVMTEEQYQRIMREVEENHAGARNAGRPMLLEGGLDWRPMGYSPSEMEFLETKNAAAREIALAFGVPPQLLGLPGDNTYSNYQEANRAFYRQTVLPLVRKTAAALSGWLGGVVIEPDLDAMPALAAE